MSFVSFARSHGLILDYAEPDSRWHRCATEDKPKKKNGAYLWDGIRGVVKNFATMTDYAAFRDGTKIGRITKNELRARKVIADADKRARQIEARRLASDMMKRASTAPHPYLATKGFPNEAGLVLDGELLIPMREFSLYKQLNSLQRIAADGSKLFLPGGKAKGSVFIIGPMMARERWLCEGYATGLSIREALRALYRQASIVVCFSAGNLTHIGRLLKALKQPAYVMADNDESKAGEQAAKDSGLPWVMPPEVGMDANDLHQRAGITALVNLLKTVRARAAEAA